MAVATSNIFDAAQIRRMFCHHEDSWEIVVRAKPEYNMASGYITYEGNRVGDFSRNWVYDIHDRLVMFHGTFNMTDRGGEGFGSRWINQCIDEYRNMGIDRVETLAMNIGRHAWAKVGFVCKDPEMGKSLWNEAFPLLARARRAGQLTDIDVQRFSLIQDKTATYDEDDWCEMVQVLASFQMRGTPLMCMLSDWEGVYYL